ncbi:acetyltransferase [Kiloniella litopenaei]|uniref:acetyltransferase n=1 Tax=Kiloniella litopenaei TaxID=1549748 RepID=UPI003BA9537D
MNQYIIIGAGGFGHELEEYLRDCFNAGGLKGEFIGYLDDTFSPNTLTKSKSRVLGGLNYDFPIGEFKFLLGLGDPESRSVTFASFVSRGAKFETLIHPSVYKSSSAQVGDGSILCPFSFLGCNSCVNKNSLLNIYSSIGHDCDIGPHSVLSPYATLNGGVVLGTETFLGTRATITQNCHVGSQTKISAGSVVYTNLPDAAIAIGNPARIKKIT